MHLTGKHVEFKPGNGHFYGRPNLDRLDLDGSDRRSICAPVRWLSVFTAVHVDWVQIGTEYLRDMAVAATQYGIQLPDRELACAPPEHDEAHPRGEAGDEEGGESYPDERFQRHCSCLALAVMSGGIPLSIDTPTR